MINKNTNSMTANQSSKTEEIHAKGIAVHSASANFEPYNFTRRNPRENDVVIEIKYCGICHSDIHQARSEWFPGFYPMVPGHEIAGVVSQVGSKVSKYKIGDRVGVGCFVDSCRTCANCHNHLDNYCLNGNVLTYNSLEKDGKTPTQGGYSDVIVVDENYVLKIPDNISLEHAAPLLCAGITLYSPLKNWQAGKNKKVGIIGMGGLGHMGLKIAVAMQSNVTIFSHSDRKKDDAFKMGAHEFIVSNPENFSKLQGQFDLIINTVSSSEINLSEYFNLLKFDATLVAIGAPEKPYSINPFPLIMMRRKFAGSVIGSIAETQEMLDFCGKHNIVPEIEIINPSYVDKAYERMLKSDVRYRFVIDMAKL
jgi:uncharacterized zinc-type alcohol dehydrogenase-like protein